MMRRMAALMGLMLALSLPAHAARLACVVEPPVAALVDDTGAEVIPSGVFTELFTVREDALCAAGEPGDYRLYDAEGVLVSDECFSMIHDAGDALIFCQDGLYGAMDSEGNVLIEPAWTQLVLSGEDAFLAHLKRLEQTKPVIFCGDLNVAHQDIDLKNPKTNRRNPGFTDEERGKFTALLNAGFIDTFRYFYPDKVEYSWWSYRFKAREKNVGWRIDYYLVSEALKDRLRDAAIHTEIYGSDHCPVELVIA